MYISRYLLVTGNPSGESSPLHLVHGLFALRFGRVFQQLQDDFQGHLPPVPAPNGQLPQEDVDEHDITGSGFPGGQLQDLYGGVSRAGRRQDRGLRLPIL